MRLNRFLAAAGITSRRGADKLIAAGRVTVNGKTCADFHFQPQPADHVKVDGKSIRTRDQLYVVLNKPAGFVCTRRDAHTSDTIYDLLPAKFCALAYVGRLDAQSEGLLLLTNDGDLVQRLTHPRFKIPKEYEVTLNKPATPGLTRQLLQGVVLDGQRARAARVRQVAPAKLRIILEQGINRQIRRMLEHAGFRAKTLVRVRLGNLHLGDLPRGHWRMLSQREINSVVPKQGRGIPRAPDYSSGGILPESR